ncbi:MAG: ATP-binding protein [Caldilineaceae bacterium]
MRRSLVLKLTLVIVLVGLIGVGVVAIFAQQATRREFSQFVVFQARANFMEQARNYYRGTGSWEGLLAALPPPGQPLPPPRPPDRQNDAQPPPAPQPGAEGAPRSMFVLMDINGCVVTPVDRYRVGDCLEPAEYAQGEPLFVDQRQVGTVLTVNPIPQLGGVERAFLAAMNSALRNAAITATVVAFILGLIFARYLTRPLKELTTAIHAMTGGQLKQEVAIRSQDELGELAAAFNRMSADLAHANQLRRQMTADIAHDLRNPLVVLGGYIESMRDGVLKPTDARLNTMYEEVHHLQHLVDDLWTLARADAGELQLLRKSVFPAEMLERTAAAFMTQATANQIELHVEIADGLGPIQVDPERMAQVLNNLVSNALRYTPAGGQICLRATDADDAVEISVGDNGTGIAPTNLPYIFERFYRADAARVQSNGESGLGLAIAKTIVLAHGGEISAASTPGVETTFCIRLARDRSESKPHALPH